MPLHLKQWGKNIYINSRTKYDLIYSTKKTNIFRMSLNFQTLTRQIFLALGTLTKT